MKCREVKYYLNDYFEGKLIDEMRREIELHLNKCHSCRKKSIDLRLRLRSSGSLHKKIHQGEDFWEGISDQNETDPDFHLPAILYSPIKKIDHPKYKLKLRNRFLRSRWIAISAPLGAVLLAVFIAVLYYSKSEPSFWEVESLKGTPIAGGEDINGTGMLPLGEWLITDSHSRARLKAGMAGEVDVDAGSMVKLVDTKESDYKILLKEGKIDARLWHRANHFSVTTPAVTAVDLGCSYTMEVNENGYSFLSVTAGNVLLKSGTKEEIIPAGAVCESTKQNGPGTPYFLNASTEFKAALAKYDQGGRKRDDLETILSNSGKKDALSLWYLLKNAKPGDVKIIYDKLAEQVTPPGGITIEGIKGGNQKMLLLWWEKFGYGDKSMWDSI